MVALLMTLIAPNMAISLDSDHRFRYVTLPYVCCVQLDRRA